MADWHGGTTVVHRWGLRWLDLKLGQAPVSYDEPSVQGFTIYGGGRCPSHGDGASGGAPASSHALWWLTKRYQRAWEEAVGRCGASGAAAVKNGRLVASLHRLW